MTNLSRYRVSKGYTQRKLAEISGVSLAAIHNYEQGLQSLENATLPVLMSLANVLSVPIYKLLEDPVVASKLQNIEKERGFLA